MYLVTGGAGFVGANLVRALNARGRDDVLVADDVSRPEKAANVRGCAVADVMSKDELRRLVERDALPPLTAILHQGGHTDTLSRDAALLDEANFERARELLDLALRRGTPFVYASSVAVYGLERDSAEDPRNERPVNEYGRSKLRFDRHVRELQSRARATVVGLRYFNVYGPGERHKGPMASMPYRLYRQLEETGVARLFAAGAGFAAGEHRRDFVHVDDVVAVNLALADGPPRHGIVNVGTGRSRSFNDLADVLIGTLGRGRVEYVPLDPGLEGRYQGFAEADVSALRRMGVPVPATPIEQGVPAAIEAWRAEGDV